MDEKDCGGSADEGEPTDSQSCSQRDASNSKLENETTASQSKSQDSQEMEAEVADITEDIVIEDFEDDW